MTTKVNKDNDELDFSAFEDESTGLEKLNSQDLGIPFISIVQDLSPQRKKSNEKYNPLAECGDLVNNTTNEVLYKNNESPKDEDLLRIVIYRWIRAVNEWVPRNKGGGLVASAEEGSPEAAAIMKKATATRENNMIVTTDGNHLVETIYIQCVFFDKNTNEWKPAIIAMKISHMKKWRELANLLNSFRVEGKSTPVHSFLQVIGASTVLEVKNSNEYYNWKFKHLGLVKTNEEAKKFLGYKKENTNLLLMADAHANIDSVDVETKDTTEDDERVFG